MPEVEINTKCMSRYTLKLLLENLIEENKEIEELVVDNGESDNPLKPGLTGPHLPRLLLRSSTFRTLQTLTVKGNHWSTKGFATFCSVLPFLICLTNLKLPVCWLPKQALFYLSENLGKRRRLIRHLELGAYLYNFKDMKFIENELWILSRIISQRLVSHFYSLDSHKPGLDLAWKHMLAAAEKMPPVKMNLDKESISLAVKIPLWFITVSDPELSRSLNKDLKLQQ